MRKSILALVALLGSAPVGQAAYWQGQTYQAATTPQITCDLASGVASVGGPCTTPPSLGVCNGDLQVLTRTVTIANGVGGNKYLSTSVNTFSAGDVGKLVVVPESALNNQSAYIATFTDAQNVVLATTSASTFGPTSVSLSVGTDDAPVFKQFNTWAQANQGSNYQVVLNIPSAGNCWFGTQQAITGIGNNYYWAGLNNVITEGNSSTFNSEGGGSGFFWGVIGVCQRGIAQPTGCSARINTVSAGASQVQLTAASLAAGYISRFSVNGWIMIGGIDTQSLWNSPYGYPPNPTYFEWRQITGVNAGTGVITLDRPLANTYLDTWPLYNSGNAFESDPGGPATIWTIPSNWNSTAEFKNITIKQVNQTNTIRRNVILRNVLTGSATGAGAIPSQSEDWRDYGGSYAHMEADKIVKNFLLDGSTLQILQCQSNSIENTVIRNSTFSNQLAGCGKNTAVYDSTINALYVGPTSYGAGVSFTCTRCAVTSFKYNESGFGHSPISDYSMSGGVITFPNTAVTGSDPAQRIFSPLPGNLFYKVGGSFGGTIGLVRPLSMTQDATNTYVQTNEAGGFPSWSGGLTSIITQPAPQFTSDASTGDPILVAQNIQNGCPALGAMNSCSARTFTPSVSGAQGGLAAMGKIVSLTIDVTVASGASGSNTLNPTGQFHQETVKQSDWSAYDWVPTINLKQAGKRVITPSGTTCDTGGGPVAGPCAGDTCNLPASGCYALPEAVWFKDSIQPFIAGTMNGTLPQFKITILTDQGVVP